VLAQYCDAQKRFAAITSKIINLTTLGVSSSLHFTCTSIAEMTTKSG
jgi:hypothetical protein